MPLAWLMMRLRCRVRVSAAEMRLVQSGPKPVLMPYTAASPAASSATRRWLLSMRLAGAIVQLRRGNVRR